MLTLQQAIFSAAVILPLMVFMRITEVSGKLFKIDTANGTKQLIGIADPPAGYYWSGMAWDAGTRNLYGLASAAAGSRLYFIDPFTAAVTPIANVPVGSNRMAGHQQ